MFKIMAEVVRNELRLELGNPGWLDLPRFDCGPAAAAISAAAISKAARGQA